jgi:hypothetical protein
MSYYKRPCFARIYFWLFVVAIAVGLLAGLYEAR